MNSPAYWEGVACAWQARWRDRLWRSVSDAQHLLLLRRWGVDTHVCYALKTDLFDEAATGALGQALAADATCLLGIDLAMTTVRAAAQRLRPGSLLVADVRALPLASDSIGLVVSNSTLDHLDTPEEIMSAIRELARVLAADGHLLVTLDNPQHPLLWLRARTPWLGRRLGLVPYSTGATLSMSALARACADAKLTVIASGTLCHSPRVLAVWVGRFLKSRSRVAQRAYHRALLAFERLAQWPTHLLTGRYVAVLATKPESSLDSPPGDQPC